MVESYPYPSVITARRVAEKHPSAKEDLLELAHVLQSHENSHQMFIHSRISIIAEKDRLLEQKETIIQDLNRRLKNRESVKQSVIERVKADAARDTEGEVQARVYIVNENCNTLHQENTLLLAALDEVKERSSLALGGLKRPHDRISQGDDEDVGSVYGKVQGQQVEDRNYQGFMGGTNKNTPPTAAKTGSISQQHVQENVAPIHKKPYRSPYSSRSPVEIGLLTPAKEKENRPYGDDGGMYTAHIQLATPTRKYTSPYGNNPTSAQTSLTASEGFEHKTSSSISPLDENITPFSHVEGQDKTPPSPPPQMDLGLTPAPPCSDCQSPHPETANEYGCAK